MFGLKKKTPTIKWRIIIKFRDGSKLITNLNTKEECEEVLASIREQVNAQRSFISFSTNIACIADIVSIFSQQYKEE